MRENKRTGGKTRCVKWGMKIGQKKKKRRGNKWENAAVGNG